MSALHAIVDRVLYALLALACGACAFVGGFALWGDYRVRRTKKALLQDRRP